MQELEHWPLDRFIEYARNPRKNDHAVDGIAAAIHEFGFRVPMLAKSDGTIVDGHLRLKAARKLRLETIPVLLADDMTDVQIKAFRISVNKMADLADWDEDMLRIELDALGEDGFDLELTGFSLDEIAGLQIEEVPEGLTDEDAVPEVPEIPVTVEGDVWVLGRHRVMCGSSTSIDAVEKLMDGQKADISFTSPPYNVGKTPNGNAQKYENDNDSKSLDEYRSLLNDFTNNCLLFSDYVFSNIQSLAGNKIALISHVYDMREKYADVIIWDKGSAEPAMARKVLNSRFEYVYIFSNEAKRTIGKRDFRGTLSNIVEIKSRQDKEFAKIHKATYPTEFALHFLDNFTESSVLDVFGGTGTTLIAAEKTNKNCFMMELDPRYSDVILQRWADFTGKDPVREDGAKWSELKKEYTGKEAVLESTGETYNSKMDV